MVSCLTAFGPLAADLYLPAMPALIDDLGTVDAAGQATLTMCLIGLGAGQLIWGPWSDRVGRRRPLLAGLILFTLASCIATFASSIDVLLVARLFQGVGGAAGIVLGRAIVRDLFDGATLARMFARLTMIAGTAAIIAPLLGGVIVQFTDWRGTFVALVAIGVALLLLAFLFVPETLAPSAVHGLSGSSHPSPAHPLRNRQFLLHAGVFVCATAMMFTYLTFISVVVQNEYDADPLAFAALFAANAVAIILGGQTASLLARRIGPARILLTGLILATAGSAALLATILAGGPLWLLQLTLFVTTLQLGAILPMATTLALQPFRRGAGTAAALLGGAQYLLGGTTPGLVALLAGSGGDIMGVTMICAVGAALVLALLAHTCPVRGRRSSSPPAE
ncbi:multidrug effflux MFS transporter [Microbacterium sp. 22303]|uniref:multidrug effflux MFS transporter n=1 Tax=Microbacterium sp. 22303 TaxID=3453905 RepID=UPI003F873681